MKAFDRTKERMINNSRWQSSGKGMFVHLPRVMGTTGGVVVAVECGECWQNFLLL